MFVYFRMYLHGVFLLLALVVGNVAATKPKIVYKITDAYKRIWHDKGSGAKLDGAFWLPRNYEQGYCVLGDVATGTWDKPTTRAVVVKALEPGALVNPTSFTRVWKDSGSGAKDDVAVYTMNAPSDYRCLGGVAVKSHSTQPDASKYCCVKEEYTTEGALLEEATNDKSTFTKATLTAFVKANKTNTDEAEAVGLACSG